MEAADFTRGSNDRKVYITHILLLAIFDTVGTWDDATEMLFTKYQTEKRNLVVVLGLLPFSNDVKLM